MLQSIFLTRSTNMYKASLVFNYVLFQQTLRFSSLQTIPFLSNSLLFVRFSILLIFGKIANFYLFRKPELEASFIPLTEWNHLEI